MVNAMVNDSRPDRHQSITKCAAPQHRLRRTDAAVLYRADGEVSRQHYTPSICGEEELSEAEAPFRTT
jgi:hypothetical protein